MHPAAAASPDLRTSQIVESGKFFNRRWQTGSVPGGPACDASNTGLETAAWPDRVSFVFRFTPAVDVTDGCLEMQFDLPDACRRLPGKGDALALGTAGGAGFIVLGSSETASVELDDAKARLTAKTKVGNWKAGEMVSVGLILYPVARGVEKVMDAVTASETHPLAVDAKGIVPEQGNLPVTYEKDRGWHRIGISKGSEGDNGRMSAKVIVRNPDPYPRVVRLNFDGNPFYISGISAVIRDMEGYPMGIPVRWSKNWHGPDPSPPWPRDFPASGFTD